MAWFKRDLDGLVKLYSGGFGAGERARRVGNVRFPVWAGLGGTSKGLMVD